MITAPVFKPKGHYLTAEGYPLGTTCWYTVVEHRGYVFYCCGPTPAVAAERGKIMEELIDQDKTYEMLKSQLEEWRPAP